MPESLCQTTWHRIKLYLGHIHVVKRMSPLSWLLSVLHVNSQVTKIFFHVKDQYLCKYNLCIKIHCSTTFKFIKVQITDGWKYPDTTRYRLIFKGYIKESTPKKMGILERYLILKPQKIRYSYIFRMGVSFCRKCVCILWHTLHQALLTLFFERHFWGVINDTPIWIV